MIELDGREVKVGDRMWSFINGWGTVYHIDYNDRHPIKFLSDNKIGNSFTSDGKFYDRDNCLRCLYWEAVEVILPQPKRKVKVADWVGKIVDAGFSNTLIIEGETIEDAISLLKEERGFLVGKIEGTDKEIEV